MRLYPYECELLGIPNAPVGGLSTHSSDISAATAIEAARAVGMRPPVPSSGSSSASVPFDWAPQSPAVFNYVTTLPDGTTEQPSGYDTPRSSSSVSGSSRSSLEYKLGKIRAEDPALAQKVQKALHKRGKALAFDQYGEEVRGVQNAVLDSHAHSNLSAARQRMAQRESVRDAVADNLYASNLFESSEALHQQAVTRDQEQFSSLHHGEHERYNVSASVPQQVVGDEASSSFVRARSGEAVTTVKTTALSDEERTAVELQGTDGLRRADGSLMDTTDAQPVVAYGGSGRGKEMFVLTRDGKLLAQAQDKLSIHVDQYHTARQALLEATGRLMPRDLAEAKKYGFPDEVGIGHHSTFMAGGDVRAAGELRTKDGKVLELTNASGHYQPHAEATFQAVAHLDAMGGVVHHLGEDHTRVGVMIDPDRRPPGMEYFDGIVVLASGGDLNRARALQAELRGRGAKPKDLLQLQAYQSILEANALRAQKVRDKLHDKLLVTQNTQRALLVHLHEQLMVARARMADPETAPESLATEILELQTRHEEGEEAVRLTTEAIARQVTKLSALETELEQELTEAGAPADAIAVALQRSKTGLGVLTMAQMEFVTWMEDLVQRRKGLAELRAFTQSEAFQQQKADAKSKLEALFGAAPSQGDSQ